MHTLQGYLDPKIRIQVFVCSFEGAVPKINLVLSPAGSFFKKSFIRTFLSSGLPPQNKVTLK